MHLKMLASSILSFLALAATAIAGRIHAHPLEPEDPAIKYIFTVNITAAPIMLGATPAGQRNFEIVSGGTFSGPELNGEQAGSHHILSFPAHNTIHGKG